MVKNKKDAQNELHKINDLQQQLNQLTPEGIDREIRKKWSHIKTEKSIADLKKLPVELLDLVSKESLFIEQLIQEGIDNIYSASMNENHSGQYLNIANEFSEAYTAHLFPSLGQSDEIQLELIKLLISYEEQREDIKTFKEDAVYMISSYKQQLDIIIEPLINHFQKLQLEGNK